MHNNEHHNFNLEKSLHDPMSKLYFYQAMLTLAKSMIGIFVPVVLFKLGYSLIDIALYSIGISLIYLILIPITIKVISKIGFKWTILLTTPIYISHIFILNYLAESYLYFHLAWITFGIYVSFFWPAFHSEIALNGSSKHRGSQMGTLQIITTIFATLAPMIGGLFLEYIGYNYLLILSSTLIILGFIPFLFSTDLSLKNYNFHYKDYLRLIKNKKTKNDKIAFACEGIEGSILSIIIWPIVVFILLSQNFLKLGLLLSFVSFLSIIVILYLKSYLDKKNKNFVLTLLTRLLSLNWFFKTFILLFSSIFLYFVESTAKIIKSIEILSFSSIFYNNAKKLNYMDYIILRELYLHTTKIFTILFLVIPVFIVFEQTLTSLVIVISIGVFFSLGISYMKEK